MGDSAFEGRGFRHVRGIPEESKAVSLQFDKKLRFAYPSFEDVDATGLPLLVVVPLLAEFPAGSRFLAGPVLEGAT